MLATKMLATKMLVTKMLVTKMLVTLAGRDLLTSFWAAFR